VVFGPIPKTSTGKIQKFMLRNQVDSAKAFFGLINQMSPNASKNTNRDWAVPFV